MRKEIKIPPEYVKQLEIAAERKRWSVKKYMEFIVIRQAQRDTARNKGLLNRK